MRQMPDAAERFRANLMWKFAKCYLLENDNEAALEIASNALDDPLLASDELYEGLLEYSSRADDTTARDLVRLALQRRIFPPDQHVVLVAYLFRQGGIQLQDAVDLLSDWPALLNSRNDAIRSAVEVAWLVKEDQQDGFMAPDEDDRLENALIVINASDA